VNSIGRSPESATSNPVVPDTLPNPVTGVSMAGRGDGSLDIAWAAPAKKGSDVTAYQVRVTDTTSGTVKQPVVAAPTLRATVAGLVNDNEQTVQVRAKNKLGYGPFGPAVRMQSAGTPPAVAAPTVANAGTGPAEGSSRLTISWPAVRPNGPPLTKYTVYESRNGGAWGAIGTTSPSQQSLGHTTVYDGASYRYVVTATNGADIEGPKANPTAFDSTGIPEVPGRPNVTTPNPDLSATVRVSVGDSRAGAFTQLQWRGNGRTGTVACGCPEGSVKTFTLTNMGNTSQTLEVRAYNGTNWSAWSPASNSYRPFGPTPVPGGFTGSRSGDDPVWTWNLRTNGRPITNVQYSGSFDGTAGAIERLQRNGTKGQTYTLRVRAQSAAGWSDWTNVESVTIPNPPPTKVTVMHGDRCPAGGCHTASGSCTSTACYYIKVRSENVSGNCHFQANGRDVGGWVDMSISADQTKQSINYYGFPGDTVSVNCGGHTDSMQW